MIHPYKHTTCFSTMKWRGNVRFHVVSTWNTRGVFVGIMLLLNLFSKTFKPRWNPPWRGEGGYLTKRFRPVCQQGELFGAVQLRSSRTNRSSLCWCQGVNSKWKIRVASLSLVSFRHLSVLIWGRLISYISICHLFAGCQYIMSFSLNFVCVLEFCLRRWNMTFLETEMKELSRST